MVEESIHTGEWAALRAVYEALFQAGERAALRGTRAECRPLPYRRRHRREAADGDRPGRRGGRGVCIR